MSNATPPTFVSLPSRSSRTAALADGSFCIDLGAVIRVLSGCCASRS